MPILLDGDGSIGGVSGLGGGNFQATSLETTSGGLLVHEVSSNRYTLRVDATNNTVGINTSSAPAAGVFLQVADATDPIVSLNNTGNGEVRLGCTAAGGYIGTESNDRFNIQTNSTPRITVLNNGNVGIFTTAPTASLDITRNFNGSTCLQIFNNVNSGTVARASLKVGYNDEAHLEIYRLGGGATIYYDATQGNANHSFQVAGNEVLLIDDTQLRANTTGNVYLDLNTSNATGGYIRIKQNGTPIQDIGNNSQLYSNDDGQGAGAGMNTRPGNSATMGSANTCKFFIAGTNEAPISLTSRCTGIDFSRISSTGTGTVTSNTLDDYEEGTWTPATTQMGNITSSGRYTKIGRIVYYEGVVTRTSGATLAANIEITGLPYNVSNISAVVTGNYWLDEGGPSANNGDVTGSTYTVGTSVFLIYPTSSIYPASTRYVQGTNVTQNRGISFFGWYVT